MPWPNDRARAGRVVRADASLPGERIHVNQEFREVARLLKPQVGMVCWSFMLTITELSKAYGPQTLFEEVSVQVSREDRIGLVGPNGAGKSTLFSMILGHEAADKGEITRERNMTLGHLPQETAPAGEETVLELAIAITPEIVELQTKDQGVGRGPSADSRSITTTSTRATTNWADTNWSRRPRRILAGLSFREKDFNRPLREMSGGWVMRAHLARLLMQEPDLLMLDEPTNHLDLESLQWFQEYLRTYPGAILMISHDRNFLNQLDDAHYGNPPAQTDPLPRQL